MINELEILGRSKVEILAQINVLFERNAEIKMLDGRLDSGSMPDELIKLVIGVLRFSAEIELKEIL